MAGTPSLSPTLAARERRRNDQRVSIVWHGDNSAVIPNDFIAQLLSRVDVVEVIDRLVPLKKAGQNYQACCPFHKEKSPSFSVSPTKQFYHCFGCGAHGSAITFLMEYSGKSFPDAVEELAQNIGLTVPNDNTRQADPQAGGLFDVMITAAGFYKQQLKASSTAIEYFKKRGVSGDVARRFHLGWAPGGWQPLAEAFDDYADNQLLETAGLIATGDGGKRYDRFRERVMFPILNQQGAVIGFGGRILGSKDDAKNGATDGAGPKYLSSPETPIFSKGRELYGLFQAQAAIRKINRVLVVEGYMDVVALAQYGVEYVVATLGTATTEAHTQRLLRMADEVVFSFDGDGAGRRAARKALDAALPFATDVRNVKFLFLPAEHDPDSYVRAHGKDGFAAAVASAMPLSKFMLEAAAEGCDLDTAEGLARMTSQVGPLWLQLPEGAFKRQMLAAIADKVLTDARDLQQVWQPASKYYKNNSSLRPNKLGYGPKTLKNTASAALGDDGYSGYSDYNPHDADYSSSEPHFAQTPQTAFNQFGQTSQFIQPARTARRTPGRILPASREDRVLRLLLTEPLSWDKLSAEEHLLLCNLPAPHGPLFAWLESQLHEHGPQPWAALREGLRGHSHENHAVVQLAQMPEGVQGDWTEVRDILDELLRAAWKREQDAMVAAGDAFLKDPGTRQRYLSLEQKIKEKVRKKPG